MVRVAAVSASHSMEFQQQDLVKIANMQMPFGRYAGLTLIDLPEPYVVWFHGQGFPEGELGKLLAQVYEIKVNGLEHLFEPLRSKNTVLTRPQNR